MKRALLLTLVATSIGFIVFVFHSFRKELVQFSDPYSVLPASVSFVLEAEKGEGWKEYKEWLLSLALESRKKDGAEMNPMAHWPELIARIDSVYAHHEPWATILNNTSFLFATPATGRGDQWAFIVGLDDHATEENFALLIPALYGEKKFSQRTFDGIVLYESTALHYAFVKKCLVVSSSSSFLEEIASCTNDRSVLSQTAFIDVKKSASADIPIHFYASWNDHWICLDPQFSEERKILAGYIAHHDSLPIINKSQQEKFSIATYLPTNTVLLDTRLDDAITSFRDSQRAVSNKFSLENLEDSCQCDLDAAAFSWRGKEHGVFATGKGDSLSYRFLFFSVRDSLNALELLTPLFSDSIPGQIRQFAFPEVFEQDKSYPSFVKVRYATQVGNFLFVSDRPEALASIKNSSGNFEKLETLPDFSIPITALHAENGRLCWQKENITSAIPPAIVNAFAGNTFAANIFSADAHKQRINITLPDVDFKGRTKPANPPSPVSDVLWKTPLQNSLKNGPWIVKNHNDNSGEILVQDEKNVLYLISNSGSILWKKDLSGTVMGKVSQIDALKNNKLQLLFNTGNAIYCLDRNGKDLPGFPLTMTATITCPVMVVDYEKNRNYRILVACDGGQLLNYTIEGKKTDGWNFTSSGKDIACLDYFRAGNEDIILLIEKEGKIRLIKRNGQLRLSSKTNAEGLFAENFILRVKSSAEESGIIYYSDRGTINNLIFGKAQSETIISGLSENAFVSFSLAGNEILIGENKMLKSFDFYGKKLLEVALNDVVKEAPIDLRGPGGRRSIGVVTEGNKVYLINAEGTILSGYPKDGQLNPVLIHSEEDNTARLATGSGREIIVYK
ncbi:MAG: hypothetical protein IT223_03715 [Crocinitomicaceae bacterium]|nr:hypothetical protein [Crocinitomicaceae bacterium]